MIRLIGMMGMLGLTWMFLSCSTDENKLDENDRITLKFSTSSYVGVNPEITKPVEEKESNIENLYIILFPTAPSQELRRFYIPSLSGNEISLNILPEEAGSRMVYLIANAKEETRIKLDAVAEVRELEAVFEGLESPWSPSLTTPLLMIGHELHNFKEISRLNHIAVERTVAKLELTVTLSSKQQSVPYVSDVAQYQYRYVNFDKHIYIVKPGNKLPVRVTSPAFVWAPENYTLNSLGKVTHLKLSTYLNEQDYSGALVEISLPYEYDGFLPPPEFGDEIYRLKLPEKIVRNRLYEYEIIL